MTEHSQPHQSAETVSRPTKENPELIPEVEGIRYLIPVPRRSGEQTAMYEYARYYDDNDVERVIMSGVAPERDSEGNEFIPQKHISRENLEKYKERLRQKRVKDLAEGALVAVNEPQPTELVAAAPAETAKQATALKFRSLQSLADKLGGGTFELSVMRGQIAREIDRLREELPGEEPTLAQAEALLKAMDESNYSSVGRRINQVVSTRLER